MFVWVVIRNSRLPRTKIKNGFTIAVIDNVGYGFFGVDAIRGREQQLIDFYGGIGSSRVLNKIRGVSKWNIAGRYYHFQSDSKFGNIAPFTGY